MDLMIVHRIGTHCLSGAESYRRAAQLVATDQGSELFILVVSPVKGQADAIENLADAARHSFPEDGFRTFTLIHSELWHALGGNSDDEWEGVFQKMQDLLHGISLVKHCTPRTRDLLLALVAKLSALLLRLSVRGKGFDAQLLDSSEGLLLAKPAQPYPEIDREATRSRIRSWASQTSGIVLVTGFLASSADGTLLSMGRNGGDFTASLFAEAMGAGELTIWSDTDGLPAADPDQVPGARRIRHLGFEEAMELAYFGSDVLHPYTMIPLVEAGITLNVKNLWNPQDHGTVVSAKTSQESGAVTGITSISEITLINVEGGGMVGIPGFASRVFGSLSSGGVNVIMISQASSEHSICIAVRESETNKALSALGRELVEEYRSGRLRPLDIQQPCSLVSVIGESMRGMRGLGGRVFSSVGRAGANVLAIAQGSSERNISFAVRQEEAPLAVRALYQEFFGENL